MIIKNGWGGRVADDLWRGAEKAFIMGSIPRTGCRIVDVGGANGSFLGRSLPPLNRCLYVVDTILPERQDKNVEFIHGDIRKLPFKDNSFDVVFARSVLHHVYGELDEAVSELYRVTKKNGVCIVSEPLRTPWGTLVRSIPSSYHDPGEHPMTFDELMTSLCRVFPCGSGEGFGVFAPWLSFLSQYVFIPQKLIRIVYKFDKKILKKGFYPFAYQMVWIMEKWSEKE